MINYLTEIKNRLNKLADFLSLKNVIDLDWRSLVLFLVAIISFFVVVTFKLHGSSLPVWNKILKEDQEKGLLLGTPRGIRSDEWLVETPFILAQLERKNIQNENFGPGRAPLVMSLPANHFSTVVRPQNWGFFLFSRERAFSFYWGAKWLFVTLGVFLFLIFLTRGDFWISVFGSAFVFSSSFIQWWFSSPSMLPEMIGSICLVFIANLYLLQSRNKSLILIASLVFIGSLMNFLMFFYPAFQVPLIWLFGLVGISFLLTRFDNKQFKKDFFFRLSVITGAAALAVLSAVLIYFDLKETIGIILQTSYPGSRVAVSGGVSVYDFLSGYFGHLFRDDHFPKDLFGNISEGSNFILLFPLPFLYSIFHFVKKRAVDKEELFLIFAVILFTVWILFPLPQIFGDITFFKLVPAKRAFIGLGLASIFLTVRSISIKKEPLTEVLGISDKKANFFLSLVIFIAGFSLIYVFGTYFNKISNNFIETPELLFTAFLFSVVFYGFLQRKKLLFFVPLALFLAPNLLVNPISQGLNPIFGNQLSKISKEIKTKDPERKILVYESLAGGNLLKAQGLNVFNGVNYTPPLRELAILDSENKYREIYNRYAHIYFLDGRDEAVFSLVQADYYRVHLSPCSPKIKELGITHIVSGKMLQNKCLLPEYQNAVNGFWFYQLNN